MPLATQLAGFVLLMIGVGTWLTTGAEELTALIPALLGLPMLLLGMLAERRPMTRGKALSLALVLAVAGFAGTLPTALGAGAMGEASDEARIEALLSAIVCAVYLAGGVRGLAVGRRGRSSGR